MKTHNGETIYPGTLTSIIISQRRAGIWIALDNVVQLSYCYDIVAASRGMLESAEKINWNSHEDDGW
jgi:hypothetical protein